MAVSTTTTRIFYVGDGSTTVFTIPFGFKASTDIIVLVSDLSTPPNTVTKIFGTDYTITAITDTHTFLNSGGTVNFNVAPTSGFSIEIYRSSAEVQTTNYNPDGSFPYNSHEAALDYLTYLSQEQQDIIRNRVIRYPDNENISVPPTLPVQALRANTVVGFDANGSFIVRTLTLGTFRGNYAASTAYNYLDFFPNPVTGNVYVALKAYTSVSIAADLAANNIALLISAPASSIVLDYAPDTGAANAYVVTLSPSPGSYFAGLKVSFLSTHANTTSSTINVNGLGVKNILNRDLTNLSANQILTGMLVQLEYDGTQFQLMNQLSATTANSFNAYMFATATGTNTYVATVPGFSLTSGFEVSIKFTNANTGAATLNIGALGAKAIQVDGIALTSGQIPSAWVGKLLFDGTAFQLLNPFPAIANGAIAVMQEQQTSGSGTTFSVNGAYATRPLNTKVSDLASILSTFNPAGAGTFIPIAGTYRAQGWSLIGNNGGSAKARVRNLTAATDAVPGASSFAATASVGYYINILDGVFTANGTDSFAFQQYGSAVCGGGQPVTQGQEVYASLTLTKIA